MLSLLRQPYPLAEQSLSRALWQSFLFGGLIAFVLLVFQPFGAYNWEHPRKPWLLSGYGLAAAVAVFIGFYGLPKTLPAVFEERSWTVGRELAWSLAQLVLGGVLSNVYGYLIGTMPLSLAQTGYMIAVAFLVGLFPSVVQVLINYLYLLRRHRPIGLLPPPPETQAPSSEAETLTLVAENGKDAIVLPAADLLFIEADDNYCTVFHRSEGKVTKTLLRSPLGRLENQVSLPYVLRCHRSYLVNIRSVQSVTGNAQGYRLRFASVGEPVPVARSYANRIREQLQAR